MPEFELNKLVRDKLPADYERLGQKAEIRQLSKDELNIELLRKVMEEATEINLNDPRDKIISERADIEQVLKDFDELNQISQSEIETVRQEKFNKKGGFLLGSYVTTLTLTETDEWVKYYRQRPDVFLEKK